MKGKAEYIKYFLSNAPWVVYQRLTKKRKTYKSFCGHKLSMEATNSALKMAIISGNPFAAIRFGAVELSCLNNHEKIELGLASTYKQSVRYSMKNNAGFYPTDDKHLKEYGDILLPALSRIDFLGTSGAHMENYFFSKYCPQAEPLIYEGFEPLRGDWVSALYGKKVLVVSPFSSEIEFQYSRKDKLFAGHPEVCPDFELITLTAPLTCADAKPAVPSFFRTLDLLEEAMERIDFDVMLCGAGAYGQFLCLKAKLLGKQAIQTGGATQTLFGILGKRWENREHVKKWVNEYWIRPYTKPEGFRKIEGGAYW